MTIVDLEQGALSARVATAGGRVLALTWRAYGESIALLRPAVPNSGGGLDAASFPLVPFGNRVRGNRFGLDGRSHALTPNTAADKHYLRGDGWISEWTVRHRAPDTVELGLTHAASGTPYAYGARQRFAIRDERFEVTLAVTNEAPIRLPYGLGWHPYFPLTPRTTLLAPFARFWTEVEDWLPGAPVEIPADLDFREPRPLPDRWVNNGLEGWSGAAEIVWPERGTRLRIDAGPLFRHAMLFIADRSFDPGFARDYFCFEPMSHLANGHNLPGFGDLALLEPGQTLEGRIVLRPERLGAAER